MRSGALLAAAALLAGCASGASPRQEAPAPWAALVSPTAALKVVVDEVCAPAVLDGGSIEALALSRRMIPVDPRRAGSPLASRAWRLASYSEVYVFELPTGCSASVEAGDADELAAAALAHLRTRRPDFAVGSVEVTNTNGPVERTSYCTAGARPFAAAILRKTGRGRRPAFLMNLFKAQADRPPFCATT